MHETVTGEGSGVGVAVTTVVGTAVGVTGGGCGKSPFGGQITGGTTQLFVVAHQVAPQGLQSGFPVEQWPMVAQVLLEHFSIPAGQPETWQKPFAPPEQERPAPQQE